MVKSKEPYNPSEKEINALRSNYKEIKSKLDSFINEIYGEKGAIPELAILIKEEVKAIEKITEDYINLQSNLKEYSSQIENIYKIVLGTDNRLEHLEKRLRLIERKNLEDKVEPEKIIPPETTIPATYNSPYESAKEDSWKISTRLKDYFSNIALPSLSRKAKITTAALAIAGLLGYIGYSRLKSEPETVKINKNIPLTEKCPDMNIAYSNRNDKDALIKTLNSKGYVSNQDAKGYIILNSEEVCKDGIWGIDIYNIRNTHTNSSFANNQYKDSEVTKKQVKSKISTKSLKVVKKPIAKQSKKKEFNPFD